MDEEKAIFSDLANLAKEFGRARVHKPEHEQKLRDIGFEDDQLTNNALVIASIFANAVNGDIKAVEKWQELTSDTEEQTPEVDAIGAIIAERESDGKPGAVRKNRAKI